MALAATMAQGVAPISVPHPIKTVYIDWRDINWNAPDQTVTSAVDGGFNVVVLAFFMGGAATDMLQAWGGLPASTQQAAVSYAHSKGAIVMLTAGGSSEEPYMGDPTEYGTAAAKYAVAANLDGVDFDLENLSQNCSFNSLTGDEVVAWIVKATQAARAVLGPGGVISHAPQAPYFGAIGGGSGNPWTGTNGCYSAVYSQASADIDFFNVQWYDQGPTCYLTYASVFTQSNAGGTCPSFPGTSIQEIVAYGVPAAKMVLGKPLTAADGGSGFVPAATLHSWIANASSPQAVAGVMAWSWETTEGPAWIHTVYGAPCTAHRVRRTL